MELKNIEYWEKLLQNIPDSYREWFKEEKKYLEEHVPKDAKVLEVGCGDGRSLKDLLGITHNLTGIDHEKIAVEHAKNNFKEYPDVNIELAEAEELPFEDRTFDVVTCMGTFANFGDKKYKILKEIKRVLKDDGIIIVSVFSEDAFEERIKMYRKLKSPIRVIKGTTVIFEEIGDNISEQFSQAQLTDIFTKVKLKILDIRKKGIAYLCKLKK